MQAWQLTKGISRSAPKMSSKLEVQSWMALVESQGYTKGATCASVIFFRCFIGSSFDWIRVESILMRIVEKSLVVRVSCM